MGFGGFDPDGKPFVKFRNTFEEVTPAKSGVELPAGYVARYGGPTRRRVLRLGLAECPVTGCSQMDNEAVCCEGGVLVVYCSEHGVTFNDVGKLSRMMMET
jgi:hypothetical protein